MKTKTINNPKEKLLENKNFLNNQNYILGRGEKEIINNYFISSKYLGILFNKYFIFMYLLIIFFINFGLTFSSLIFFFFYGFFWYMVLGIVLLFFGNRFLFNMPLFFKNILKDFFEIKPVIFSVNNIFFSKKISQLNFIIQYILFLIIFIITSSFSLYNFLGMDKLEIIGSSLLENGIGFIIFVIIFVLVLIFPYYIIKKFNFKFNIINIIFYPILYTFLFLTYLKNLVFPSRLKVIKNRPSNKIFNGFKYINLYGGENEFYKVFYN